MPTFSVIMPVYNVEKFVYEAIQSVLAQSFADFELLIVNDCSKDQSLAICQSINDKRIRILQHQTNRGLAGARNTGIREAKGKYLAFIDSDDRWNREKLRYHYEHLSQNTHIGLSYSRSLFIHADGTEAHYYQVPRLNDIDAKHLLCRNPIGNGSAPVIRKTVFQDIRFKVEENGHLIECYFDESFRRSEDIECWLRISLLTDWDIEGIPQPLTEYRLNAEGLSANLAQQLSSWEKLIEKTRGYAPQFTALNEGPARAFQLRYLARQAIRQHDGDQALFFWKAALRQDYSILTKEPTRSLCTALAAYSLKFLPSLYQKVDRKAMRSLGYLQRLRMLIQDRQLNKSNQRMAKPI